ncbi:hypothetical protein ELQ87_13035 [Streptomyces griseoviridis]|uniref:Uncharacterized protein n=1 Tax=Streptomyces griseoviridis TaxID=45398 RepID=A0A3Q9KVL5_STRGD|nr:hypothetical protein ELQ87_13035 [Streptomyces griseoviridis]QCN90782.1 hypothetical protein DDJ31_26270 [Streptomyces griseoviridis]
MVGVGRGGTTRPEGGGARVTGGLWRHGGNRPLPLHKVMDSGNKGYAPWRVKVRPGRFIVV